MRSCNSSQDAVAFDQETVARASVKRLIKRRHDSNVFDAMYFY
jgi:hypothetical protein